MAVASVDPQSVAAGPLTVQWRRVAAFIGLTFGLAWTYNLYMALTVGYGANPALGLMLQGMMLIPAWSVLVLQVFVFADSPLHFRSKFTGLSAFAWFFLAYGLMFFALGIASAQAASPTFLATAGGVSQILTVIGLIFVIVLQFVSPAKERYSLGWAFGPFKWYVLFALLLVVMYSLMTALNYWLGLGEAVDAKAVVVKLAQQAGQSTSAVDQMSSPGFLAFTGFQTAIITPLLALVITFGEEYGWRGFLQGELIKMGKVKGIALVGLIWGVWHAPVIVMGHNYPGYPVAGVFLMIGYCVLLAFILGYAVLKSGSVFLAAYLHGVNNQTLSFLAMLVYKPYDPVFSLGAGLYGLVLMAIVVGLLLLDKDAWK